MTENEKNLDLLAIFHYIVGGITALVACIPFIHVALGLAMLLGALDGKNPPPHWLGWIFVAGGGFFILCGWTMAAAIVLAGRKLSKRQSRIYCIVVAAFECMMMPFGTVLGVFTIIVLSKDSVKALFANSRQK
ncbi:MAG TPA: hypothetical protein DCZ95_14805 [Verrucomicrobia bacterium]|nr:MAG: hypothetical protein A2X46_18090 [Lentisphaerae bacterium GWF2_57_35]HBA85354.1 hypothetical protein [Verrucomicrobiota bacterium]